MSSEGSATNNDAVEGSATNTSHSVSANAAKIERRHWYAARMEKLVALGGEGPLMENLITTEKERVAIESEIDAVAAGIDACQYNDKSIEGNIRSLEKESEAVQTESDAVGTEIDLVTGGDLGPVEHSILVCQLKCMFAYQLSLKDELIAMATQCSDLKDKFGDNKDEWIDLLHQKLALEDKRKVIYRKQYKQYHDMLDQIRQKLDNHANKNELEEDQEPIKAEGIVATTANIPEEQASASGALELGVGSGESLESSVSTGSG